MVKAMSLLRMDICNLREKLYRANPDAPFYIRSVREVGYCLDVDEP